MTRDDLLSVLRRHRSAIEAEGASARFLYGSRARAEHRPDSDVDLFVDYDPSSKFSYLISRVSSFCSTLPSASTRT